MSMLLFEAVLALSLESLAQNVVIRGVHLTGLGFNGASSSAVVTSDGQTLSVLFDNYRVEISHGSSSPQATTLQKILPRFFCHACFSLGITSLHANCAKPGRLIYSACSSKSQMIELLSQLFVSWRACQKII